MPDVTISIGGRDFDVACQEGEEHFLQSAAAMLDVEAQTLVSQIRHLTESRMLLMSGLMLADKTAGLDDQLKLAEQKIAKLEAALAAAQAAATQAPEVPAEVTDTLAELAARAEAMAQVVEEKAAG
ncbi:MAG TPA: cell division protein ZapA [Rhodobacterales bacterium]|nr:cell division protein ZapA [Rhodobacterales bacterium]